jgi:SAM-dependent methyltransferase
VSAPVVLASARAPELVRAGLRALINGVWLGVLGDAAQRRVDERYYAREALYRTEEWNARGLTDWERELIGGLAAPGARVLVVGCGGGREVLGLLEAGYDASGCESHPALCAFAESFLAARGHPGRVAGAARDAVPAGGAVDAVVIGWGAYSLVHGSPARVAMLAQARARGDAVLLSGFGRAALGRELVWTHRVARALGGRAEPGDTMAPNRAHVFTRGQLAGEAAAAGLTLEAWHLLGSADRDTRYMAATLR